MKIEMHDTKRMEHGEAAIRSRVARCLWMLTAIQAEPHTWTRRAIAERYSLHERQIDKDVRLLRDLGYNLRHSRDGYWLAWAENFTS